MGGDKGVLGVLLRLSVIVMVDLPCMEGICGPYIGSTVLTLYIVIGQLLITFLSPAPFSVCVHGHPTIFCSILDYSSTLISCLWKYVLLHSTVFRKV